jgi:hypothetical protein
MGRNGGTDASRRGKPEGFYLKSRADNGRTKCAGGLASNDGRGMRHRIKEVLLNCSKGRDGGCVDDEGEGGMVSEMRQDFLNRSQVLDDEGVEGVVSEMVNGP